MNPPFRLEPQTEEIRLRALAALPTPTAMFSTPSPFFKFAAELTRAHAEALAEEYENAMADLPAQTLTPQDIESMAQADAEKFSEGRRFNCSLPVNFHD